MKKHLILLAALALTLAACSNRAPETAQRDSRLIRRPAQTARATEAHNPKLHPTK